VALYDVVDIATRVRREGSGREVPRYIIRTRLGEVDFGLSSTILARRRIFPSAAALRLILFHVHVPGFTWPAGVEEDVDGKPVVPVVGLLKTTDFALS
jgi:lysine 2,3-aminomutase